MSRTSVSPSPSATGASSVSASLPRIAPFVDPMSIDPGRRLTELELDHAKLQARLVVAEKQVSLKDQEMHRLLLEHRTLKSSMETIIKNLVEKNKQLDADCKRKLRQNEEAMQNLVSEQAHHAHSSHEVKRAFHEWKRVVEEKERDIDQLKELNQQLVADEQSLQEQLDILHQRLQKAEEEVDISRRSEDELQQDLDAALTKLSKADEHIHKLSSEVETNTVDLVQLRHLYEAADIDARAARQEMQEFEGNFSRLVRTVAGEMDRLTLECGELFDVVRNSTLKRREGASLPPSRNKELFLLSPEKAEGAPPEDSDLPTELPSQGERASSLLRRLLDAVALCREDIVVCHRATAEVLRYAKDIQRRGEVLSEALEQARATALEACDRADDLQQRLTKEQDKVQKLEASLVQSTKWMDEAATLQEESASRTQRVVNESRDHQLQIKKLQEQVRNSELHLSTQQTQHDATLRRVEHLEQEKDELVERLRQSEKRLHETALETEELQRRLQDRDNQLRQLEHNNAKLESEKAFAIRQAQDAEDRVKHASRQVESIEAANSELRGKLFDAQKRMDQQLRSGVGSISAVMSSTPSRSANLTSDASPIGQKPQKSNYSHLSAGQATTSVMSTQRPLASSAEAGRDGESVDKVRQWEDRINALLSARTRV